MRWGRVALTLSLSSTVLLQTQETFSMLLLFNTHVGESLTDYSFKSRLSIGHTSFKLIKIMGGIKKTKTSLEEHLRNAFLYLGVVVMIFSPQLM